MERTGSVRVGGFTVIEIRKEEGKPPTQRTFKQEGIGEINNWLAAGR